MKIHAANRLMADYEKKPETDTEKKSRLTQQLKVKQAEKPLNKPGTEKFQKNNEQTRKIQDRLSKVGAATINETNAEDIKALLEAFFAINPDPADAQIHSLASALGLDKEALESQIYSIIGTEEVTADMEDVLEDPHANESVKEVSVTDGETGNDDPGYQKETFSDGADVSDVGVGLSPDILSDDNLA